MNFVARCSQVGNRRAGWKHSLFGTAMLVATATLSIPQALADERPLVLERTVKIPDVPVGPYSDGLSVDLNGGRLFVTPQAAKAVGVLDLHSARVLKMIPVGNPHGVYFSAELKRLFVTDGANGDLKVFSGADYSLIKSIPLTVGADGLAYDPQSRLIYVANGGEAAKMKQALISVIDPANMIKLADIPVLTEGLEGAVVDPKSQLLYVNMDEEDHAVAVVDLRKRQVVSTWKLPVGGHRAKSIELDTAHSRLYVACRDSSMHGTLFVLDTADGHTVASLPIAGWADGMFLDQKRQRIYISSGNGYVETFTIEGKDVFHREAQVESAILAKTSLYSAEDDRLYVSVPHLGDDGSAEVMIYKPLP